MVVSPPQPSSPTDVEPETSVDAEAQAEQQDDEGDQDNAALLHSQQQTINLLVADKAWYAKRVSALEIQLGDTMGKDKELSRLNAEVQQSQAELARVSGENGKLAEEAKTRAETVARLVSVRDGSQQRRGADQVVVRRSASLRSHGTLCSRFARNSSPETSQFAT